MTTTLIKLKRLTLTADLCPFTAIIKKKTTKRRKNQKDEVWQRCLESGDGLKHMLKYIILLQKLEPSESTVHRCTKKRVLNFYYFPILNDDNDFMMTLCQIGVTWQQRHLQVKALNMFTFVLWKSKDVCSRNVGLQECIYCNAGLGSCCCSSMIRRGGDYSGYSYLNLTSTLQLRLEDTNAYFICNIVVCVDCLESGF